MKKIELNNTLKTVPRWLTLGNPTTIATKCSDTNKFKDLTFKKGFRL